jgi:hypothetical protein
MSLLVIICGVIGIPLFAFLMYNWHKQRDFEGTGRMPPENYD